MKSIARFAPDAEIAKESNLFPLPYLGNTTCLFQPSEEDPVGLSADSGLHAVKVLGGRLENDVIDKLFGRQLSLTL